MTDEEYRLFGKAVVLVNLRGWVVSGLRQVALPGAAGRYQWLANVGARVEDYPKLPITDLFSETGVGATVHAAMQDALDRTSLRTTGLVVPLTESFAAALEARS